MKKEIKVKRKITNERVNVKKSKTKVNVHNEHRTCTNKKNVNKPIEIWPSNTTR